MCSADSDFPWTGTKQLRQFNNAVGVPYKSVGFRFIHIPQSTPVSNWTRGWGSFCQRRAIALSLSSPRLYKAISQFSLWPSHLARRDTKCGIVTTVQKKEDNDEEKEEKEIQGRSPVVATNTDDWCDREMEKLPLMRVQCLKLVTTFTLYEQMSKADSSHWKATSYKFGITSQKKSCEC